MNNIGTTYSPLPQVRLLGPNYLKLNTPIPEFIGNFEKLEILYLSGLKLTGKMPLSYKNLLNLKYFSVNNNMLEGELDDDFFYLMKDLISLDLGANKFTGKIPNSVSELTNLLNLDLHQNSFTGPLPDLSKLSNLGNGVFDRENGGFHGACYLNGLAETITKPGVCLPEKVTVPSKCSIGKVQLCTLDEMRSNKSSISVFVFGAGAILGITVGCFVLLALLLFLGICLKMRRISKPTKSASPLNERFEQNSNTNSLTGSDVPFNTQYPKDE
ncbi:hypothetical protein HK099_006688 [Clydaea vesicula]|uniref:Uncharacterized protein n=1 Tax=Clydaea vesicula TaxID=447962 RepID=A0AAD5TZY1_9FUNG|nr:hypothetical protein HK099_006688 [Clydaea vesicula]